MTLPSQRKTGRNTGIVAHTVMLVACPRAAAAILHAMRATGQKWKPSRPVIVVILAWTLDMSQPCQYARTRFSQIRVAILEGYRPSFLMLTLQMMGRIIANVQQVLEIAWLLRNLLKVGGRSTGLLMPRMHVPPRWLWLGQQAILTRWGCTLKLGL
jgi:hypothetical protein